MGTRLNILIDEKLIQEAIRLGQVKTKREAVDLALRTFVRLKKQGTIRKSRGKLQWEGDLDQMRRDT